MITERKFEAVRKALAELSDKQGTVAATRKVKESLETVFASLPDSERLNIGTMMTRVVGRYPRTKGRRDGGKRKRGGLPGMGRAAALEIIAQVGMIIVRKE